MINSLIRGFQQLFDPPTRRLVILSALTALGVLIVLAVVLWFVLAQFQFLEWQWAERAVEIGAGFLLFVLVWLLFPAALSATVGLFLDSVASQVERTHYPNLPAPRKQALHEAMWGGVKLALGCSWPEHPRLADLFRSLSEYLCVLHAEWLSSGP